MFNELLLQQPNKGNGTEKYNLKIVLTVHNVSNLKHDPILLS